ncbi:MAG: acetolactate synthase [Phycisphaerae bacterium]
METCVQFSLFLVNKPGVLTQVFAELGKAKVNVIALAMMDSMEHGVLRMVVDHPDRARLVFQRLNYQGAEAEVLAVGLPNKPGAAADLCEKLAAKKITIGYMYCSSAARGGKTTVYIKVPDVKKAVKVLDAPAKGTRRDMKVKLRRPAVRSRR